MKNILSFLLVLGLSHSALNAQSTAMDFTMNDCNGNTHHLFSELDSNNVVIMEFFHTCPSCVQAAADMKPMIQSIKAKHGNKLRFFVTPEDDTYPCSSVLNWMNSNGFAGLVTPFDSGSVQCAYYGGLGMPTIAVAAGSQHKLLYLANASIGFTTSDTTLIGNAIRNFLDSTFAGMDDIPSNASINLYPNPVSSKFELSIEAKESGVLKLGIANMAGQTVADLAEEKLQAGAWSRGFSISLPDGIYFVQGTFNGRSLRKKITVQH